MRRPLLFSLPLLLAATLVLAPRPASGCAVALPRGGGVTVSGESALIVYDAASKTEHFIRTADFQSTSAEFGFLVPTPTKPELAEASADVFATLADITERRTVVRKRAKALNFECGLLPEAAILTTVVGLAEGRQADAVRVVEQKRVGDFDAVVLQASDPVRLREWLSARGYDARPALEQWFEAYTKGGWYLTAFKIAFDSPAAGGASRALISSAVRISFTTDQPIYPYREPADMRGVWGSRSLRLFVLSDERVSGTIGKGDGAKAWPGKTEWSNAVPAERMAAVAVRGKLPEAVGRRAWHLTEFLDRSSPRPGTDELYLSKSADQSSVERPPNVVWEEYDPWPWLFGSAAALLALDWVRRAMKAKAKR